MQEQDVPFSQACENNKHVILDVLKGAFAQSHAVLEIGSGTGQHAVHFAKGLPHLTWQTADQPEYHPSIHHYMTRYPSPNLKAPIALTLPIDDIPAEHYDGFFTANTAHIMQKEEVMHMMRSISQHLTNGGVFCQYGPFTIDEQFTSQSNAEFHHKLINNGCGGYRDINELKYWAEGLVLDDMLSMPANNLMLIWRRRDT